MARIAIIDFGMGNFHSVMRALQAAAPDQDIHIARTSAQVACADRIIFPGQGAMPDCMRTLAASGLRDAVIQAARSKPLLGICVGEQMLFEHSTEGGNTPGLGLLAGQVRRFSGPAFEAPHPAQAHITPKPPATSSVRLKIPHMGWNTVQQTRPHTLWREIAQNTPFYFVHSYFAQPDDPALIAATSLHGQRFCCAIAVDNIFAVQFHPEKSASPGLQLYRNFTTWQP